MRRAAVSGAGRRGELGTHAVICAIPPPMTPPPMMPMDLTPGKSVLPERSLGGVLNSYASSDEAYGTQTRHAAQHRAKRRKRDRQTPLTLAGARTCM